MRKALRHRLCALLVLTALPSCGWLFGASGSVTDPSEAVYRAAMADFSTCAAATSPEDRAAAAMRLADAARTLQADTRPGNPDHFFMTDRVVAAHRFCAATR